MQSGSVPNTITLKATSQEAFFFSLLPLATSSSFICHLLCYTRNTLLLYGSLKSARTSLRKEKAKAEMTGGFRRHRLFLPRLEDWSIHSLLLTALHMVLRSLAYASRRNRHIFPSTRGVKQTAYLAYINNDRAKVYARLFLYHTNTHSKPR